MKIRSINDSENSKNIISLSNSQIDELNITKERLYTNNFKASTIVTWQSGEVEETEPEI